MSSIDPATRSRVQRFEADVLVHLGDLYRVALRLTGNAAEAEDLTQDTCVRAFECLDQLRNPEAARAWALTILRSLFLRRVERQPARSRLLSLDDVDASALARDAIVQDAYEMLSPLDETSLGEVRRVLADLDPAYREPVVLAHLGGFSYKEIAHMLGIPLGTVMSRVHRGRRLLRSVLRDRRSRTGKMP
jgi:RNA polymerase sigma-70 factor, ECF subfamily